MKNKGYSNLLEETKKTILSASCRAIHFSKPILELQNLGVIYPNTITVIQGQKGVHKSRFTELLATAFISQNGNRLPLNLKRKTLVRFNVLYVDTERNVKDQLPFAIQKIKTQAGFDISEEPAELEAISLIKIPRSDRYNAIDEYLQKYRNSLAKEEHSIIILDVLTDCVKSFNDVNDSMLLIDKLNEMISDHNVSFICVIHENPSTFGDSKARGHLGTEIINKASQVIQIGFHKTGKGFNRDLIVARFLHSRNSKRLDDIFMTYSKEENGLKLADSEYVKEQINLKAEKANLDELKDWLHKNLMAKKAKNELLEELKSEFSCASRTLEDRLKDLTDTKFLVKIKESRKVYFNLYDNTDDLPF